MSQGPGELVRPVPELRRAAGRPAHSLPCRAALAPRLPASSRSSHWQPRADTARFVQGLDTCEAEARDICFPKV